jgi:anthranilate phosphoribosyltransferase
MFNPYLHKVLSGASLSLEEMAAAMGLVMEGEVAPTQIAAFMIALRMKGESPAEIAGAATAMRRKGVRIATPEGVVVDTCGTGGDHSGSFNISTTTAFVVAGAGAVVAKHGNHSFTSASGSADLLAALGVRIDAVQSTVEKSLAESGIGFLYAPQLHQAMRHAAGVRKELEIRSIFNLLGPLSNPAGAQHQVVGVYDKALIPSLLPALELLGAKAAMVVHGADGLDELTTTDVTHIGELTREGELLFYTLDPTEFGLARARKEDLRGGSPEENAAITMDILNGVKGPKRDIVVLNAAAALIVAGMAADWREGIAIAREAIDSGRALAKLEALVTLTQSPDPTPEEASLVC